MTQEVAMELLDLAADAIIRCKDGVDIPVSLYCMLSSCTVLRDLATECSPTHNEAGKRVIDVCLDSCLVSALIDAIHSRDTSDLSPAACQAAMLGAKALGASREEGAILDNMLCFAQANRRNQDDLEMHMHFLLDYKKTRQPAARLIEKAFPTFEDAANMLKRVAERSHGFSHEQIKELVPILCRHFVPCSTFVLLMGLVPPETLNADKVMEVLGGSNSMHMGSYFHPKEMSITLQIITAFFEANNYDPVLTRALITIASSINCYDVAPMTVATFNGSIMSFVNATCTSALVNVEAGCPKIMARTLSPFLKIEMDRNHGRLTIRVKWAAVDGDSSFRAGLFRMRVTVFTDEHVFPVAEHWRTWKRRVPRRRLHRAPAPCLDTLK